MIRILVGVAAPLLLFFNLAGAMIYLPAVFMLRVDVGVLLAVFTLLQIAATIALLCLQKRARLLGLGLQMIAILPNTYLYLTRAAESLKFLIIPLTLITLTLTIMIACALESLYSGKSNSSP